MKEMLTDREFLDCIGTYPESRFLKLIHNLRQSLATFSILQSHDSKSILPSHRIESDLGISHLDSLDLVDFALSIEADDLNLGSDKLVKIAELNEQDGTVKELAEILLNDL